MLLPPTKQEVNAFAHVRLSVCLLARLLRNTCMDLDEMLRVDKCRDMDELINFWALPEYVCVCLSVCLSRSYILSKRINISSLFTIR